MNKNNVKKISTVLLGISYLTTMFLIYFKDKIVNINNLDIVLNCFLVFQSLLFLIIIILNIVNRR